MGKLRDVISGGTHPLLANATLLGSVSAGLTAAGSNQATALALDENASVHMITTAAASTGVRLAAASATNLPGDTVYINNGGANSVTVYPATGESINALSANTGRALAAAASTICVRISATQWLML